jgi:hypothetical protein
MARRVRATSRGGYVVAARALAPKRDARPEMAYNVEKANIATKLLESRSAPMHIQRQKSLPDEVRIVRRWRRMTGTSER